MRLVRTARAPRGFTLVELLVSLVVSSVALVAAVTVANAQQRAYYDGQKLRAAQNNARAALLALERILPRAGYGMDAPLALDFQWYAPAAVGTCPAQLNPCSPDRVDDSDEITIYARNPAFWVPAQFGLATTAEPAGKGWRPTALSTSSLTVRGHVGDRFRKGQILQLVCSGLAQYAYVTIDQTFPLGGPVTVEGQEQALTLAPEVAGDPFKQQTQATRLTCLQGGVIAPEAKVFQIDRYRFHVRPVDVGGGQLDPFLVLDNGVDNDGNGVVDADDEQLLAEGIESIQIGYVFAEPTLPEAGTTGALTVADAAATPPGTAAQTIVRTRFVDPMPLQPGASVYDYSSFMRYGTVKIPAARKTNAQANIRALAISVVARSPEPDPATSSNLRWIAGSPLFRMNQTAAPAWITAKARPGGDDGYQRAVVDTDVVLHNMLTRTVSYY